MTLALVVKLAILIPLMLSLESMLSPKCNRGFTLTELMVAAGVLGVLSLGILQLITNMMKSKDDFQSRIDLLGTKMMVERVLADPFLCVASLHGTNREGIQLETIYQESVPDKQYPEKELSRKYVISAIRPFNETFLEEGKNYSGITVGPITFDKMLIGSNPMQKRFRLNLNVPLIENRSKEIKKTLNWPIEVKVDPEEKNLIVKCQLHFLDMAHYDSSTECVNWGRDSEGMDTGLCARGQLGGFAVTKISPSDEKETGIATSWRRIDFAKDNEVTGCASLSPFADLQKFITGICWGEGFWLIKSLGPTEEDRKRGAHEGKIYVSRRVQHKYILGCMSVTGLDSGVAQSGICWGEGLHLIKTSGGQEGIEQDWNVATHLPDLVFTSCISQDIQRSEFRNREEMNLLCTSLGGIAFVKITPMNSMEGDHGIGLDTHVSLHD